MIRLDEIVAGVEEADVVLKGGDQLLVPDERQEVTVLGEVQYATSHVFERGLGRDEYINRSGGLSQRADKKRIYVVRANGEVVAESGGGLVPARMAAPTFGPATRSSCRSTSISRWRGGLRSRRSSTTSRSLRPRSIRFDATIGRREKVDNVAIAGCR